MKISATYLNILLAIACLIASIHPAKAMNDGSRYAAGSVLSKGKWIQLRVTENAIYKLTYDDLKKMGIDDPAKVKIYGYGGWILEQDFTKPYVDDLPEVAVYLNKGSDNVFNSGDFLLFYGRGTVKWTYNSSGAIFEHQNNPYSTYGTYFVTESEQGPKELPTQDSYTGAGATTVTTFDDYLIHERDSIAILASGRELFGESFIGKNTQSFSCNVPGITSDAGKVRLSFAAYNRVTLPITLSIGGTELIKTNISITSGLYQKATLLNSTQGWPGEKKEQFTVTVSITPNGQTVAHLNYFTLNLTRRLQAYDNGFTFFRNKESLSSNLKYVIGNAGEQCRVWNVTGNFDAKLVQTVKEGNNLSFGAEKNTVLQEYVLVDAGKSFPTPQVIGEVKNQDLHALSPTDMVIIAPEAYFPLAEKLAEKHREQQGLRIAVVQPEAIYNEFSSGAPDATAYRRFMKMFYDRAEGKEEEKPKYLLLYGDGFFDNRHLTPAGTKMDLKYYLLTYQFAESLDETSSHGTDDYFGFLDDNEGVNLDRDQVDIGIGRFPVNSVEQAENALNKVLAYMDNTNYNTWKNTVIFTADDAEGFKEQAEKLAQILEEGHPEYMVAKSYMDAYQPVDLNGKKTYPDAKKKLLNTLKSGCFLMNYTGHGSPTAMSGEDMMNIRDIRQMTFKSLPIWITATCDFGRFDEVSTSAGEEVFLNKKSAGIALFTTSRVVYSDGNQAINLLFIRNIFTKTNGKHATLGDIIHQSKSQIESKFKKNGLNFVLLGDPALKLNYPEWEVALESINGEPLPENDTINFRALDKIKLEGKIVNENGETVNDFTGKLSATIFDGKQTIETVNSQGTFTDYPNVVYKGNNTIENGHFTISFRVPLDISYEINPGKMNFYAWDEAKHADATGSFQKYTFFGTNDDINLNDVSPEVTATFLNSDSFRNGDNVNEAPFFYAAVADKEGINMTGSGGHAITISIDRNPVWTYPLNEYYQPENDLAGTVGFPIPALPQGEHELIFRVWNILNISATDTLRFTVVKGLKPDIYDISAGPNPAKEETHFRLTHNRPETAMEVEIRVYDLTGRTIWTHRETGSSGYIQSYPVEWNLTNGAGQRVSPGIYIYQAIIKTPEGKEATKSKKLIVQ
ncbi:MAG: type IX secretion system sortase PorU [Candidatus Symbiothrix sp.]|jgi:hypothetical protein|nr:type IX secretion system sortase PorU [Candidatus Symbiothrix sp.]